MENQNQNVQLPQGWKDVNIIADMPLTALIQFFNVLNQRLCAVEDNTFIQDNQGNALSLTQIYAMQTEEEMKAQQEQEPELRERAE